MKQRGRSSSAALALVDTTIVLDRVERQSPPDDLTNDECKVWVRVVDSEPADWFTPATVPILAQHCRHVVHCQQLAGMLNDAKNDPDFNVRDYDRLLKMQERETKLVVLTAMKMRLTQSATINHNGNRKKGATRKPWQG